MKRRLLIPVAVALCVIGVLVVQPISNRATRVAALAACGAFTALVVLLPTSRRFSLGLGAAVTGALLVLWLAPSKPISAERLRSEAVRQARAFQGTRYVWGGESFTGIDCSGLVRRSYVNAYVREGLRNFDAGLLRGALGVWWNDCTARDMAHSFRGLTRPFGSLSNLKGPLPAELRPGDLAVTSTGVHVLIFAGDATWVEADPSEGRVLVVTPADRNGWLDVPVTLVRWTPG